jgi:hypothetical protein
MADRRGAGLEDPKINVKLKLAGLWTSTMFLYVYGDFFGLFQPGEVQKLYDGKIPGMGPSTQGLVLFCAIAVATPALMIVLSLVMKPVLNRWVNIVLGLVYTLFMLVTMPGAWWFYLFLGVVEIVLTLAIVWVAWTWPRQGSVGGG